MSILNMLGASGSKVVRVCYSYLVGLQACAKKRQGGRRAESYNSPAPLGFTWALQQQGLEPPGFNKAEWRRNGFRASTKPDPGSIRNRYIYICIYNIHIHICRYEKEGFGLTRPASTQAGSLVSARAFPRCPLDI